MREAVVRSEKRYSQYARKNDETLSDIDNIKEETQYRKVMELDWDGDGTKDLVVFPRYVDSNGAHRAYLFVIMRTKQGLLNAADIYKEGIGDELLSARMDEDTLYVDFKTGSRETGYNYATGAHSQYQTGSPIHQAILLMNRVASSGRQDCGRAAETVGQLRQQELAQLEVKDRLEKAGRGGGEVFQRNANFHGQRAIEAALSAKNNGCMDIPFRPLPIKATPIAAAQVSALMKVLLDTELAELKKEDPETRNSFQVEKTIMGDLDGDGVAGEAAVLWSMAGPTFMVTHVAVISSVGGKPGITSPNDGIEGLMTSMELKDGHLVIEAQQMGPEDARCCPSLVATATMGVKDGKLVKIDQVVKPAPKQNN